MWHKSVVLYVSKQNSEAIWWMLELRAAENAQNYVKM